MNPVAIVTNKEAILSKPNRQLQHERRIQTELKKRNIPVVNIDQNPSYIFYFDHISRLGEAGPTPSFPASSSAPYLADKWAQHKAASAANIPVPATMELNWNTGYEEVVSQIGSPFIVKPIKGTMSIGVDLIDNDESFFPRPGLLAQQAINSGQDVSVIIIGNKPVLALSRKTRVGSHKIDPFNEGTDYQMLPIDQQLIDLGIALSNVFDIQLGKVNLLVDQGKLYFNEINFRANHIVYEDKFEVDIYGQFIDRIVSTYL